MFFDSFFFGGGFDILFFLVFFLVIGMFVMMFVRGIGEWNRNNQSPRLTVEARIVAKRTNVSHHTHCNAGDVTGAHGTHSTSSTSYYVTFEVESGDRMELQLGGSDYGMLAEGDTGHLTFQGTRYLGFNRQ
ncbi:DUF2500 domain-containing protein [Clostridium transplantifaecale]|uniref:DUF2500 domain-containing protein n=1 Tax=Clostridium transplantifaecale TaxID=2479838 RepID=UPI000F63B4F4|nr:DUF2500 domain-containing protein [Clostridium transplantifaecale]